MATGNLTNLTGTFTLEKQTGTVLTLKTNEKRYVPGDIVLTLNAQSANPSFKASPTGSSTATSSTASISSSTNNSGVLIQTKYSIDAATISYNAAANGWINKAANATTGSSTTALTATNGTAYYINGVTLTAPSSGTRSFTITVPNGSVETLTFNFSVDANGNTTIT